MARTPYTWTPLFTGTVVVRARGAAGGGRGGQSNDTGGGGGGGAAVRDTAAVVNGVGELIEVADQSATGNNGDMSFFRSAVTIMARGGSGAPFGSFGAGGPAASSVGTVKYSGGPGAWQSNLVGIAGGGGGASADDYGDGDPGAISAGGPAAPTGAKGGDGGLPILVGPPTWTSNPGSDGDAPGGGGGGGGYANPGTSGSSKGGQGAVDVWLLSDWPDWATPGSQPAGGATPIASYGAPFPPFPAPPFNPKATKRGFIM